MVGALPESLLIVGVVKVMNPQVTMENVSKKPRSKALVNKASVKEALPGSSFHR